MPYNRQPGETTPEADVLLRKAQEAFQSYCERQGVAPAEGQLALPTRLDNEPAYLRTAADFAFAQGNAAYESHTYDASWWLKELVFSSPDALYAQAYLDNHWQPAQAQTRGQSDEVLQSSAVARVGHVQNLIRGAARAIPDLTATGLIAAMHAVALGSITHPDVRAHAKDYITPWIIGAQHEVAFEECLKSAGLVLDQSYFYGHQEGDPPNVDYTVSDFRGGWIDLDVNAKLEGVKLGKRYDPKQGTSYARNGVVNIYSYLTSKDLGDRFSISPALATSRGAFLRKLIPTL